MDNSELVQNTKNPIEGRPQCLEPVTWVEGWPIMGVDVDHDGIGEPVLSARKPILGYPVAAPQTDDEFVSATLGPQWEWNHNPRDDRWSLSERPGWLRLKASVPVGEGGFWGACNTVSQRLMGTGHGEVVAKLDLSGMEPGQKAGFTRFSSQYNNLGVYCDKDGVRKLFFSANGEETPGPEIGEELWIRTVNNGEAAHYAYSTNGKSYENLGAEFTLRFGNWCGDRLGFFCWNSEEAKGNLDIDYFHYDYDGPKGKGGD